MTTTQADVDRQARDDGVRDDPTVRTVLERASEAAPRPELDWERDWQGRPRILPDPRWEPAWVERWADGRANDAGEVPYTRVTTFAEALQDASALTKWKLRRAIYGQARRPDYVTAALGLSLEDRDRDALNDLAEKCLEAAGPNAAEIGTALHSFTERVDRGEELGPIPPEYETTVAAYARAVSHLRFVERECRTVCDDLEVAGTPDGIAFCDVPDPDGVVDELRIVDTKTGRVDYSAGKFSTQLAVYAHSRLYHPGTGERTKLEERYGAPVSTRWGLLVHTPAGAGTAELLWIDLEHGWAGAQQCKRTREWRQEATAGRLLRPVFARAPRPATADGSCRGRKADGKACGYRAKRSAEGMGAQFCGRHQEQVKDLQRWLAENPDMDPADGVESEPPREPVQTLEPSMAAAQAATVQAAALDAAGRAEDAAEDYRAALAEAGEEDVRGDHLLPNSHVAASPRSVYTAADGVRWVKVQRDDTYGWEREQAVIDAGGAENLRCTGTGLLVTQCGCSVHRPESADLAQLAYEQAAGIARELPDPERPAQELPRSVYAEQYPDPLMGVHPATVGTYALDPAAEVNGNPRAVSGLQDEVAVMDAAAHARAGILLQIAAAQSESDLLVIYQANATLWSADLTTAAGARSRQLSEQARRAKPEAALIAALQTAPDHASLTRLWSQFPAELWTAEAQVLARSRWQQLAG
jgi:hypothetical protein